MIRGVVAQCTVTDLDRAEEWYARLFESEPHARPMPGLLEWRFGPDFGVQVWSEPARAGTSSLVLNVSDLDEAGARLAGSGVDHEGPQPGGGARILVLTDPDGNRVVLSGA